MPHHNIDWLARSERSHVSVWEYWDRTAAAAALIPYGLRVMDVGEWRRHVAEHSLPLRHVSLPLRLYVDDRRDEAYEGGAVGAADGSRAAGGARGVHGEQSLRHFWRESSNALHCVTDRPAEAVESSEPAAARDGQGGRAAEAAEAQRSDWLQEPPRLVRSADIDALLRPHSATEDGGARVPAVVVRLECPLWDDNVAFMQEVRGLLALAGAGAGCPGVDGLHARLRAHTCVVWALVGGRVEISRLAPSSHLGAAVCARLQ